MPIDQSKYPPNWRVISDTIRARAKDCCERCGVRNYAAVQRLPDGSRIELGRKYDADGKPGPTASKEELATAKWVNVRCACAHVHDPNPMNCAPENLAWWCNLCHNRHDMAMRAVNISATKRKKRK